MDAESPLLPTNLSAQTTIAPFAIFLTAALWVETWLEIFSHGVYHSPDDLSKLYLGVMAAYAGAAEISKWLVNVPTHPAEDPMFERIHRGGFFIALWLVPLMAAWVWRIMNAAIPMPPALERITGGLVAIFFIKATSRRLRHKKHGVMTRDAAGDEKTSESSEATSGDSGVAFEELVYARIAAAPDGMAASELLQVFPNVPRTNLYRAFDKLIKAQRITRTGKPRTADVKYKVNALPLPAVPAETLSQN